MKSKHAIACSILDEKAMAIETEVSGLLVMRNREREEKGVVEGSSAFSDV
jgi:hypothetical protein